MASSDYCNLRSSLRQKQNSAVRHIRAGSALAILQFGFDRARVNDGPFSMGFDKSSDQLIVTRASKNLLSVAAVIGDAEALFAKQPIGDKAGP
jgi:hypothetical protein